jgi:hypothetical protein
MDHIFLMLETSSVKSNARLIRIDALRTDKTGRQLASYSSPVSTKSPKFLFDVLKAFEHAILNQNLGAQYVIVSYFGQDFYREVFNNACKEAKLQPLLTRSWIGVEQLAWPLAFDGKLKSRSIEHLAEYLAIVSSNTLWTLQSCYWILMRRLTTGIMLEDKARLHGGSVFEFAQKMVRQF